MDYERTSSDNGSNLSNTDSFNPGNLLNDVLFSAFPSEKMLKYKNLNFNKLDYNKSFESTRNVKETYLNKISRVTGIFYICNFHITERNNSLQSNINKLKDSTTNTLRGIYFERLNKYIEIQVNDISFNLINNELDDVYKEIEECKNKLNLLRAEKSQLEILLSNKTEEYGSNFTSKMFQDSWSLKLSYLELLLGVTISNESGAMKISFSKLGISNPYRTCSILLKLTDDKFTSLSCDPPLKNFNKLVYDLNNGLDFGLFLCLVRHSFKTVL